ncbi:hypothetical protein MCOR25_009480, partial [Pyricularia grisea]
MESGPALTSGTNLQITPGSAHQGQPRNRIRFSCTKCREKKLKCNRETPCDQCTKRNIGETCVYVPYARSKAGLDTPSAAKSSTSQPTHQTSHHPDQAGQAGNAGAGNSGVGTNAALLSRLRHLERLVHVLKAKSSSDVNQSGSNQPVLVEKPNSDEESSGEDGTPGAGPIFGQSRYVEFGNWEAILDEITELTGDLRVSDDNVQLPRTYVGAPVPSGFAEGPVLLMGAWPRASYSDLLSCLPARNVVDQLTSHFFQAKEPAWMMFHIPAFLRQYDEFWKSPEQFTFSWLALLFTMMSHGTLFCLLGDIEAPENLGDPLEIVDKYRSLAAHCLVLDDYTKPDKYKLEALLLYTGIEHFKQPDARRGTSMVSTIACRLAIHMGLHRDPKHFKGMSAFEGEMRRRMWIIVTEVDRHVSYQFGLPCNIQARLCDTEPPRNLHDEDFNESTIELPPSRPETEQTRTLYSIVKARLLAIFAEIFETSHLLPRYSQILELDRRLEEVHDSMPVIFAMRSFRQSIGDSIYLAMQRYWLDLVYQKARCVLHRRVNRFPKSRWACVDAAVRIMRHQYDVHVEMQPGGRLARERLFISSLYTHDFLLANMILCAELSHVMKADSEPPYTPEGSTGSADDRDRRRSRSAPCMPKEDLLEILRTSRDVWQTTRHESSEADRAFKIISRMLTVATGTLFGSSPDSTGSDAREAGERLKSEPPTCPPRFDEDFYGTPGALGQHAGHLEPDSVIRDERGLDPLGGVLPPQQWGPHRLATDYVRDWAVPAQLGATIQHDFEGILYPGADMNW